MSGRPALLFAPAGLAGLGAALAIGGTAPIGALAWAGVGAAFVLALRPATPLTVSPLEELQRHIARCRRRGERAAVLVAHVPGQGSSAAKELASCFRITDSVTVTRTAHSHELVGVFDDDGLDRAALERRLRAVAGGAPASMAWAGFPDDGVTLDTLLETARTSLPGTPSGDAIVVPSVLDTTPAATPAETK